MERKSDTAFTQPNDLLSRTDVAIRFGVAPQTITRWANEGILPCVRTLGGQRRYPAYEVERLLSRAWEHGLPGADPPYLSREHGTTRK
ncbi:MAG: helix-turn-helix domain-containing protein [Chloroflexi bacterium]|nr:helix-turn-helix domain-containing protein [Chloroflexota bacterium]